MPLDKKSRHRGIAFISFWSQDSVDAALKLTSTNFGEHTLKVNMAGDKPAKDAQADSKTKKVLATGTQKEESKKKPEQSLGSSKEVNMAGDKPAKDAQADSKTKKVLATGTQKEESK